MLIKLRRVSLENINGCDFFAYLYIVPEPIDSLEWACLLTRILHGVVQDILEIIEYTKFLNEAVDRTFNIHTDEWNLAVINKSLRLLHSKTIRSLF